MSSLVPDTSLYTRSQAALGNLLSGDFEASARSTVAPLSLSPKERESLGDRLLGKDSPLRPLVDVATNPFVLLGAALTIAYPVATAERMFTFAGKLGGYGRRLVPGMKWLSDFHDVYRGTDIPALFERVTKSMDEFQVDRSKAIGSAIDKFQKASGRSWDRSLGVRLAAKLDGLDNPNHAAWELMRRTVPEAGSLLSGGGLAPITLDTHEQALLGDLRSALTETFKKVIPHEQAARAANTSLQEMGLGTVGTFREHYLPHVPLKSKNEIEQSFREFVSELGGSAESGKPGFASALRNVNASLPTRQAAKNLLERGGWMLPNPEDLQRAGLLKPGVDKLIGMTDLWFMDKGAPSLKRYSLNLLPVVELYHQQMGRMKSWTLPSEAGVSLGKRIGEELGKLKSSGDVIRASMLADTYIPLAAGRFSAEQALSAMQFSDARKYASDLLQKLPIPQSLKDTLQKPLAESPSLTLTGMGSRIQSMFYLSTLGANPASAMTNLMQTVITTFPTLGLRDTVTGITAALKQTGTYAELRLGGMAEDAAFTKAFPRFQGSDFNVSPVTSDTLKKSLADSYESVMRVPEAARRTIDKAKGAMMWAFQSAERFNRVAAYEGAYAKAARELPGTIYRSPVTEALTKLERGSPALDAAAHEYAGQVSRLTQFGGGPLNAPAAVVNWWAPFRQFTQFPLRYLGFLTNAGTTLGSGETGGRNFGTLGRAVLGSGLIYGVGKEVLHMDISRGLLESALPGFTEAGKPFAPLPLVPPILQLAGSAAMGVQSGDFQNLIGNLPLLVPGGTALARASTAIAPKLAPAINRPFADYDHVLPDGRIPVFSNKQGLIGYYSPVQLFSRAAGLGDLNTSQERVVSQYLLKQRDRIREFRRDYLIALANNDATEMQDVDSEYQQAYPGLGSMKDQIRKSDIQAVQMRREVPRIERIMATMPSATRQQFAQVVSVAMASSGEAFLGVPPESLGSGTPGSRRKMRARSPGSQAPSPATTSPISGILQAQAVARGEENRDELNLNAPEPYRFGA